MTFLRVARHHTAPHGTWLRSCRRLRGSKRKAKKKKNICVETKMWGIGGKMHFGAIERLNDLKCHWTGLMGKGWDTGFSGKRCFVIHGEPRLAHQVEDTLTLYKTLVHFATWDGDKGVNAYVPNLLVDIHLNYAWMHIYLHIKYSELYIIQFLKINILCL